MVEAQTSYSKYTQHPLPFPHACAETQKLAGELPTAPSLGCAVQVCGRERLYPKARVLVGPGTLACELPVTAARTPLPRMRSPEGTHP